MRRIHLLFLLAASLLLLTFAACGSETAQEVSLISETSEIDFYDLEDFDPGDFDERSTIIDNQWFPLQPGTQWIYEGTTIEDGEIVPHRVVFTVTDLTKEIEGVRTVVVWDQDFADDELIETEIAFFAQDKEGNVWHFGQYPEEFEDGIFVDAPTWIANIEDAQAGISMKAEPRTGTSSYSQGWAPAVGWTDRAQVYKMSQQTCIPYSCYGDVLVMDEFSQEEPGSFQQKYYARGVGNVRVGWRGEDAEQEELGLVDLIKLSPGDLEQIRTEVLALEKHAYEISDGVYGITLPSEAPATSIISGETITTPFEDFDANNFDDHSIDIDNVWFPLQPGTQWILEGFTVEGGVPVPHRVVFTVTDLTKMIEGVRTIVTWDQDFANGELVETELAFFAQDKGGNVWHFGQYPEEYETGRFVDAPAWIAGVANSHAGISMKADPLRGTSSYSQGWAPAVDWTDRAQVYRVNQQTCVPHDCFEGVLVMDEFSQEEPGAFQLKYYASGVGNVRVGWRGEDETHETLELVELLELNPEALAEVHKAVLELEDRAYAVSMNVYGQTPPVEGR